MQNLIAAGVVVVLGALSIGAVVWGWITYAGPWLLVLVLFVIGGALWAMRQVAHWRKERQPSRLRNQPVVKYPDWLTNYLQDCLSNPSKRIKVTAPYHEDWIWGGVGKSEPYIEVIVTIYNMLPFSIIVRRVQGRFTLWGTPCNQDARKDGSTRIPAGEEGRLRVTQPITSHTSDQIALSGNEGRAVDVTLSTCQFVIEFEAPGMPIEAIEYPIGNRHQVVPKQ